jgi:hypothetical protein
MFCILDGAVQRMNLHHRLPRFGPKRVPCVFVPPTGYCLCYSPSTNSHIPGAKRVNHWETKSKAIAICARLLSFNRTQPRVIIGLIIEHNTLKNYLHLMVITNSPLCKRCGAKEESQLTFCVRAKLRLHSDIHTWAPFLDSSVKLWEPSSSSVEVQGSNILPSDYGARRACLRA